MKRRICKYCYDFMGVRQHRCPFYLLKITKNDLDLINKIKQKNDSIIELYQKQLNSVTLQYQTLKGVFDKIVNVIRPYLDYKQNYTLEEVVENSLLNNKTKKSTISLISQYKKYFNEKLERNIKAKKGETDGDELISLYDPKNAFEFISNHEKKYQRGTIKKNLNTLLRYIKLATKNPLLSYEFPIGKGQPSKLKHIITDNELKKFIRYLNSNKYYVLIVICMIMYKFGLRIGPLAKIKVRDFLPNNIIIFKEKNSLIIKRKLLDSTAEIIQRLINECGLKEDDFMFYYFKFENDEEKRCQFFAQKLRNVLHESNCFSLATTESLSSHIFRATYAVNSYQNNNIEKIQSDLGHKLSYTTLNSYVHPERRNLNLNEEQRKEIKGIEALKMRINEGKIINNKPYNNAADEEENSLNLEEEGEDYIDDDIDQSENIFYFTGHFYDDIDIIDYKNKTKNNGYFQENYKKNNDVESDTLVNFEKSIIKEKKGFYQDCEKIKLNSVKAKDKNKKKIGSLDIFGIQNYSDSVVVKQSDENIIFSKRIKNKNELYQLTSKEYEILEETLRMNKKGIYNNIQGVFRNGKLMIEASNNIEKNVLITMIGGIVFLKKNNNSIEQSQINKKEKSLTLLYFKTANSMYDRLIKLSKNSLVNYLFQNSNKSEENLDIIKIVDTKNLIKLLIITNREIKKGEILSLNRNLLMND